MPAPSSTTAPGAARGVCDPFNRGCRIQARPNSPPRWRTTSPRLPSVPRTMRSCLTPSSASPRKIWASAPEPRRRRHGFDRRSFRQAPPVPCAPLRPVRRPYSRDPACLHQHNHRRTDFACYGATNGGKRPAAAIAGDDRSHPVRSRAPYRRDHWTARQKRPGGNQQGRCRLSWLRRLSRSRARRRSQRRRAGAAPLARIAKSDRPAQSPVRT